MAGQELLALPAAHGMLLGEEISSMGYFLGDRPQNSVSMKEEVFQLKWGSLMETGGGDQTIPPPLGHAGMIPHRLFAPSVLRCRGSHCGGGRHLERGSQLGWLNVGTARASQAGGRTCLRGVLGRTFPSCWATLPLPMRGENPAPALSACWI